MGKTGTMTLSPSMPSFTQPQSSCPPAWTRASFILVLNVEATELNSHFLGSESNWFHFWENKAYEFDSNYFFFSWCLRVHFHFCSWQIVSFLCFLFSVLLEGLSILLICQKLLVSLIFSTVSLVSILLISALKFPISLLYWNGGYYALAFLDSWAPRLLICKYSF